MNDVTADAVAVAAVAQCPTTAGNGIGNDIVHGPGPFDNYIGKRVPFYFAGTGVHSIF
jgi:hypothetical protein